MAKKKVNVKQLNIMITKKDKEIERSLLNGFEWWREGIK